jgi:NhaP-type Na+/H+ or K+/H+ antiporter
VHGEEELIALLLFVLLVLAFSLTSASLNRWLVTAPLAFVSVGAVVGLILGPVEAEALFPVKPLAEITLVLILFHDAAQVRPREVDAERKEVSRLLLIGFPLTLLVGFFAARILFPDLTWAWALLLAAALAPTDAGLGAATVLNPVVPTKVRRMLNVESGVNDGLVTPVVLFAIAVLAGAEGRGPGITIIDALLELAIGTGVGVVIGGGGGWLLGRSRDRRWSSTASRALGTLTLPLLAYGGALLLSGNGFVAAFVSGTAFAGAARWIHQEESALELAESFANPLGYAVWLIFGLAAVPFLLQHLGWVELLYAVLALTAFRMGPVWLSLQGSGLKPRTVAFVGWFGPRGLASIVFALIALESLNLDDSRRTVLVTISMTVLLSVVAHGVTAEPFARRYGAWVARTRPSVELDETAEPRSRGGLWWHKQQQLRSTAGGGR